MHELNYAGHTRVSKREARKLFDEGKEIVLCSCKMLPLAFLGSHIKKERAQGKTFDQIVNAFEYYNCSYEEGYYASYYTRRGKL